MDACKRMRLIAHDNRELECVARLGPVDPDTLAQHACYATGTTERAERPRGSFYRSRPSSPGLSAATSGCGAGIAEGRLRHHVLLLDPLEPQAHDVDVKALLRWRSCANCPIACNRATADFLL